MRPRMRRWGQRGGVGQERGTKWLCSGGTGVLQYGAWPSAGGQCGTAPVWGGCQWGGLGSAYPPHTASPPQYQRHLFVHISQHCPSPGAPPLESVDVRQIYDKFPEKKGGLRELYDRGPPHAFFLVKFWVSSGSKTQSAHESRGIPAAPLAVGDLVSGL